MRHRSAAVIAAVAAFVVAADQAAKALVRDRLSPPGTSVRVLGDLVRFTHTRNTGAAFGMLPGNRYIFVGVSIVVIVSILVYAWRSRPSRPMIVAALGLVCGGAAGNLIDRAFIGYVTDFVQVPFDFPVFNVADSAIVVGVAMLVWWLLFGPVPESATPVEDPAASEPPVADPAKD